ncbi:hypothetical protein [Cupriavidus agavae]|uniref:Uncharacterized protein n=1 Tax=Cupriavidus agavae TaxID=1001822 RepID=A0A4Q7S7S7_9BURK|nr:hypothetical protein [Cupriavidus agavae]RZT42491.1 hypothetical protein EV147_1527 [Cupriavidus agavae]
MTNRHDTHGKAGNSGRQEKQEKQETSNPGVREDRDAGEIKSRSADPGQSSYGGFKNEDPGKQHQGKASGGTSDQPAPKTGK